MNRNIIIGTTLVVIGLVLIIQRTIGIDINLWNYVWPLFLIVPGIGIHYKFFSGRENSSSLVIGGILLTYGIMFLFNSITNGVYHREINFVYPLGIAIGFFESYIFGDKDNKNLIVFIIFLIMSLYMLLRQVLPGFYNIREYVFPSLVILLGVYILIKNKK